MPIGFALMWLQKKEDEEEQEKNGGGDQDMAGQPPGNPEEHPGFNSETQTCEAHPEGCGDSGSKGGWGSKPKKKPKSAWGGGKGFGK
jgi:hypothetical protein